MFLKEIQANCQHTRTLHTPIEDLIIFLIHITFEFFLMDPKRNPILRTTPTHFPIHIIITKYEYKINQVPSLWPILYSAVK